MAIPRVFVSSTCYDLRYIRENLKFFIKSMGFEPVLSEGGGIFYDPSKHVHDACLAEVPNCQMFVLIIGGRFGSQYKSEPESIVNHEYREAVNKKIPVFAMVEQQVHAEYRVYQKNKENKNLDVSKIAYPGVDSTKIFNFMEEVQGQVVNNALVPFSEYNELESYLKQQWAGMMFSFLTNRAETERMMNTLDTLTTMSNRIEFLSKQILSSVGKDKEKLMAELYEVISRSDFWKRLPLYIVFKGIPLDSFLEEDNFQGFLKKSAPKITRTPDAVRYEWGDSLWSFHPSEEESLMKDYERMYQRLRANLLDIVHRSGKNIAELTEERRDNSGK
ncbi:MAG TPA: DUF4062 domain-containing protein [Candidatus Bathyarchaeia archaeon]|nr:DUF4062 domain-containing protein [Candidatus Bathyarchaeia archaeon]